MEIKRTPPLCRPQLRRHCLNPGTFSSGEEMKISRIRKKYHSRVTGLINAMWKSRKGGLCPGSVRGSPAHTHPCTAIPCRCQPIAPPDPTTANWGPLYPRFVQVLLSGA